jgi:hypothetical protein
MAYLLASRLSVRVAELRGEMRFPVVFLDQTHSPLFQIYGCPLGSLHKRLTFLEPR